MRRYPLVFLVLLAVTDIVPRLTSFSPVLPSDVSAGFVAISLSGLTYSAYAPRGDRLVWSALIPPLTSGGSAFTLDAMSGIISVTNTSVLHLLY